MASHYWAALQGVTSDRRRGHKEAAEHDLQSAMIEHVVVVVRQDDTLRWFGGLPSAPSVEVLVAVASSMLLAWLGFLLFRSNQPLKVILFQNTHPRFFWVTTHHSGFWGCCVPICQRIKNEDYF